MPKPNSDNRYRTGGTPVFYWKDGTKLRLTDRSALPTGALVIAVFENMNKVPQSVIDDIAEYNTFPITLTQYQSKNKTRITDDIKVGRLIGIESLTPTAKDPSDGGGTPALFTPSKQIPRPRTVIKLYNGGKYWRDGYTRPPNARYWWDAVKMLTLPPVYSPQPDVYEGIYWRVVDGIAVSGSYIHETIEVIENTVEWNIPGGGVLIPELNTAGVYSLSENNYGSPGFADGRNRSAYVGMGTYEEVARGKYEEYFDHVLAEGGSNTYNPQLGANFYENAYTDWEGNPVSDTKIGVKVNNDEWCTFSSSNPISGSYVFTHPAECIISGGNWVYAPGHSLAGQQYVYPTLGGGDKTYAPQIFDNTRHYYGNYYPMGVQIDYAKKRNEIFQIKFRDIWGAFQTFNTADETNFHMSRVKYDHAEYDENINSGILIPANSNPTIEVLLIPKKWHYIIWTYGLYNNTTELIPKWITTEFDGTAPEAWGQCRWYTTPISIETSRYDNATKDLMYWCPTYNLSIPHHRYSYIKTPTDLTFGPAYSDPWIEDMITTSLSWWLKSQCDQDGRTPQLANGTVAYPAPAYSAWSCPAKKGSLVAILRIIYPNGAIDHRYVYAKTDGVDLELYRLMGYANFYGHNKYGGACQYVTPENWLASAIATYNYNVANSITPNPTIAAEEVVSDISTEYKTLYTTISNFFYSIRQN